MFPSKPIVCREWMYVPPDMVVTKALEVKVPSFFGKGKKTLYLYKNKGDRIGVPRYFLRLNSYPPVEGTWKRYNFTSKIRLREHQKVIVNTYLHKLKQYPYGGIIQMPTGTGKTIVGLELIARLKYPTLIVVHRELIFEQWCRAIKKFLGMKAGIIKGSEETIRPVTVAMLQTLMRKKKVPYSQFFGHVIYDEVHVMGAEKFNQTIPLFNPKIRTGLSATPERKDGLEYIFQWHIGDIIAKWMKPAMTPKVLKVEFKNFAISSKGCFVGKKFIRSRYLKRLNIERRNKLVAKLVKKAYQTGYKILILSDSLELLREYDRWIDIPDKAWLTGNKKTYSGKERVILATYGAGGTGFDAPDVDCIILATPRADVKQAIGRALRPLNGKRQPWIIDIVEQHIPIMRRYYALRKKDYPVDQIKVLTL